jgi:beta-lactamase regulating signal transducer with metallopeptidase domain
MIATLITGSLVVGACSALAAIIAEWTLSSWRGAPLRWVWLAAMLLTLMIPVVREVIENEPSSRVGQADVRGTSSAAAPPASAATARPAAVPPTMRQIAPLTGERAQNGFPTSVRMPDIAPRLLRIVAWTWGVMSLLLACVLAWSAVRMRRDAARWPRTTLHGAQVLISEDLGPALVGLVRPQIVVPPWVLQLEEAAARTILVHEEQHRQAGDSRLIAAGWLCLIVMPWHPMLWWMSRRLLRAVEFDCDARVVARGVRTAVYADQLLGAMQYAGAARRVAMTTAFAEQRSQLGKRISHLLRPMPRRAVMMRMSGSVMTAVLVAAAVGMPRVELAQSPRTLPQATGRGWDRLLLIDGVVVNRGLHASAFDIYAELKLMAVDSARTPMLSQDVDSAHAVRRFGAAGVRGAWALWTRSYLGGGGKPFADADVATSTVMVPSDADRASAIATRLLSGVSLRSDKEAGVRRVVLDYEQQRRRLRGPAVARAMSDRDVRRRRDAAIRGMIADRTQRAQFERNAVAEAERPEWRAPTLRGLAASEADFYLVRLPVSAQEQQAATEVIQRSMSAELALYAKTPQDTTGLRALQRRRVEYVRAVLRSDATRLAFDQRRPMILRTMPSW